MHFSKNIDNFGMSVIREIFAYALDPDVISFGGGSPAPELYPLEEFSAAAAHASAEYGASILAYDVSEGFLPLREIIADQCMQRAGVNACADDIRITSGSQQGIDFTARMFIEPGDTVICEAPSYLGALNSFDSFMPRYAAVPMDENGMIMEALESVLQQNPDARFIYTIPDFQNPAGVTMSLARRRRIVELANQYGVPILEDAPYGVLRFEGEHLPSIKSFDTRGMVIFLGSFSKIVSPGLRIGWVCANQEVLGNIYKIKQISDLHTSTIGQRQLTSFLQLYPLKDHIETLIPFYKRRRDTMLDAMQKEFPDTVSWSRPQGGFFCWLSLPEEVDTGLLFETALNDHQVVYVPGETSFAGGGPRNQLRLSYSQMTEDKITEGITRLGALFRSL